MLSCEPNISLLWSEEVLEEVSSDASLWPANHSMVSISILGVTDPDGDPVTVQIDRIMQDEPTNGTGDGDTCPDAQGVGTAAARTICHSSIRWYAPGVAKLSIRKA